MSLNLVYDRAEDDETSAATIRSTYQALGNWSGLTDAERAQLERGTLTYNTLNRVESAVKTLAAALTAAGYPVEITPVLKGKSRVPSGYTEVEYIAASGTQYVDSGVAETADTAVDCKFDVDTVASDYLFGTRQNSSNLSYNGIYKNNVLEYNYNEISFMAADSIELTEEVSGTTNNITINGASHTAATGTGTGETMLIFAIRYQTGYNNGRIRPYGGATKLRHFKIKQNGALVRDYIPCKNPDGVVGLYDIVGGEFYTTPLAEEPVELPDGYTQVAYLQSTGSQYIDTGVQGDSDVRVTADFEITAFGSGTTFIFGAQGTDSVRYTLGMTSAGVFRSDFGSAMTSGSAASLNTRYSADKNGNVCSVGGQTLTSAAATFTGTTNIYLFGRSYSSVSCSQIKMYRCKMYKAGTLIRDFVPCKNPDGVAGLYDIVNGKFYTTSTAAPLPAGYTQIEYLQSSGTQHIDTGFKPNNNSMLDATLQFVSSSSGNKFCLGARTSNNVGRFSLGYTFGSGGGWFFGHGAAVTTVNTTSSPTDKTSVVINKNVCTVAGQSATATASTFSTTQNLVIFADNEGGKVGQNGSIKLYDCSIYDNGTLVRNFVPARNSSGTLGLYDTVNSTFYTNAGSGTFTAGADIVGFTAGSDIVGFTAGAEAGTLEDREWQEGDILYRPQWTTYLSNVQRLRDAYYTLADTGQLPATSDKLGYEDANTIEKVLADIDILLDGMKSIYRRAGTFTAGGNYTRQTVRCI